MDSTGSQEAAPDKEKNGKPTEAQRAVWRASWARRVAARRKLGLPAQPPKRTRGKASYERAAAKKKSLTERLVDDIEAGRATTGRPRKTPLPAPGTPQFAAMIKKRKADRERKRATYAAAKPGGHRLGRHGRPLPPPGPAREAVLAKRERNRLAYHKYRAKNLAAVAAPGERPMFSLGARTLVKAAQADFAVRAAFGYVVLVADKGGERSQMRSFRSLEDAERAGMQLIVMAASLRNGGPSPEAQMEAAKDALKEELINQLLRSRKGPK